MRTNIENGHATDPFVRMSSNHLDTIGVDEPEFEARHLIQPEGVADRSLVGASLLRVAGDTFRNLGVVADTVGLVVGDDPIH